MDVCVVFSGCLGYIPDLHRGVGDPFLTVHLFCGDENRFKLFSGRLDAQTQDRKIMFEFSEQTKFHRGNFGQLLMDQNS